MRLKIISISDQIYRNDCKSYVNNAILTEVSVG